MLIQPEEGTLQTVMSEGKKCPTQSRLDRVRLMSNIFPQGLDS